MYHVFYCISVLLYMIPFQMSIGKQKILYFGSIPLFLRNQKTPTALFAFPTLPNHLCYSHKVEHANRQASERKVVKQRNYPYRTDGI